jgi:HSP20 family protein
MTATVETQGKPATRGTQTKQRSGWLQPAVNIIETKDGYHMEAEMPGVGKDGLEVLLEGNELTIVGERSHDTEDRQLLYRESFDQDYRRSFELDPTIDTKRISARMENGMLHLELPKAEEVKPRKIAID